MARKSFFQSDMEKPNPNGGMNNERTAAHIKALTHRAGRSQPTFPAPNTNRRQTSDTIN